MLPLLRAREIVRERVGMTVNMVSTAQYGEPSTARTLTIVNIVSMVSIVSIVH